MVAQRDWKTPFLETLRNTGNVRLSCTAAGIDRTTAYKAREKSPEFAAGWADALEDGVDVLEATARKRAMAGSDMLLLALLKAHRPHVYGDRVQQDIHLRTEVDPERQRRMVDDPEAAEYAAKLDERIATAGADPRGLRP